MKINRQELIKTAGYVGVGLLIAGYVRYSVQEVMGTVNEVILIVGAVLLIGSLALNFAEVRAYSGRRSTKLGANTTVMTAAVLAILGFANFLGYRHHKRFDLTTEKLYSLSDQTRKVVSGLQTDVKVIKFDKTDDSELRDQMHEYRNLSSHISYDRVDPQAKPEVANQYKITHFGEVIVASDKRTERPQDTNEQTLTDAILKVTMESVKSICFLEGHGEKSISSTEGDGYDTVSRLLKNENYETKKVNLVSSNQVPSDCEVLVVAGPKQGLFPQEAAMIGKYLDGGGKVMLLLDPDVDANLGDVIAAWNIKLGNDTVIDTSGVGRLFGTGPGVPLVMTYGSHPVTKDMEGNMSFFPLARSVSSSGSSGSGVSDTELLKTSDHAWAVADLKADTKGDELVFDESRDKKGPISLGVAASKPVGDKEARLVVIGDSDFATNTYSRLQRNGDLFLNAVSWLAQDENLISIRPKAPTDRRVTMNASQQNLLFWLTILFLPGAVIGSGVYIWWKRR
jgi:ABC-type uncharacterized transport system involved in gliding motility auxiliary subunit